MFDMNEVMKEVSGASESEGTLVSCEKIFDNDDAFILRDEAAGAFVFQMRGNVLDIYSVSNKINHSIIDEDGLQRFINSVIRGIDPYIG